jgi:predicted small lipoprotein YifL
MSPRVALPAAVALLALLSACGQKGPLYLPDKSAAVVTGPPQNAPPASPPAAPATPPAEPQDAPAQPAPAPATPKKSDQDDSQSRER